MSTHVLIVDDEANHRRSLAIGLRMEGFEVTTAADGQLALEAAAGQPFDVALVDLMMPRVDGLELARRLRLAYPEMRVVLMSANHLTRPQLVRAGLPTVGFLPKPYELSALLDVLYAQSGCVPLSAPANSQKALGV